MKELLPENRELLDAYRQADPDAFEVIYRSYVEDLAVFLRRGFQFWSKGKQLHFAGFNKSDDLMEVLNETFLLVFGEGARKGYNGLTSFRNYLLTIARNVVIGRFRKDLSRLGRFRPMENTEEEMASESEGAIWSQGIVSASGFGAPDKEAEGAEIRRVVSSFVAELSEEQKQVVQLYFMEHLSQAETGAALSINRYKVRKQIRRIRKKLYKRLCKEGLDRTLNFSFESLEAKP